MTQVEKFKIKKDLFNSQFKKSHDERTYNENVMVQTLFNIKIINSDKLIANNYRSLGAAEVALVNEGYLTKYEDFKYIDVDKKFLWFTVKVKEKYKDHIIRLIKECLKDKGII